VVLYYYKEKGNNMKLTEVLKVRISIADLLRLKKKAEQEKRSVSDMARISIQKYIEKEGTK
jgi:hypothetical protein